MIDKKAYRQAAREAKTTRIARQSRDNAERSSAVQDFPRKVFTQVFGVQAYSDLGVAYVGMQNLNKVYTISIDDTLYTLLQDTNGDWSVQNGAQKFVNSFNGLTPEENLVILIDTVAP